jgi:hexokinase
MGMGKGFAMSASLDLGKQLLEGYETSRDPNLPRIKITAIANDAVSTLVSFAYQLRSNPRRKAGMGLIVGTGCNATIPLALSKLHPSKRPKKVKVLDHPNPDTDIKINVNTEWTIKGAAKPLHDLGFITRWDSKLDAEGEAPGFQPFEYMTAGRYLGELGRIIIVEYFTQHLSIPLSSLPLKLRKRMGLTTTFLGNLGPHLASVEASMVKQLETELPPPEDSKWTWTEETTQMAFKIAKAIQVRAAGMVAAAVIGLLTTADEIHFPSQSPLSSFPHLPNGTVNSRTKLDADIEELMVGYTGGTIVHFQDYLRDCQGFLDAILREEFGDQGMDRQPRVVLSPCHDGGILGAGILAGTVRSNAHDV